MIPVTTKAMAWVKGLVCQDTCAAAWWSLAEKDKPCSVGNT